MSNTVISTGVKLFFFCFVFLAIQVLPNQVMLSLEPSASSLHDWAYSEASGRREISQWQKGSKSTWVTGLWEIYEGGWIWGDVQLCCSLMSWYSWTGRFFHINAHWNCFEQNLPYAWHILSNAHLPSMLNTLIVN